MTKTTISVIKADVGSLPGHVEAPEQLIQVCDEHLNKAVEDGVINDYYLTRCGDDIEFIMSHFKGVDNEEVHKLAWDGFNKAANKAKELKLYGAGQDLLKDAFSGNVKGMGPGVAEMEFEERGSDPIIVFCADKTEPAAFNLPMYKIFADAFNTAGLVIDPNIHDGFTFEVHDIKKGKKIMIDTPEEVYDLLSLIGTTPTYVVKRVFRKKDKEIAAVVCTEKLSHIAGKYVGKDDPVAIVRCQSGFPAVGEVIEPFTFPHLVAGFMRGSHRGPLMPVSEQDAVIGRFDGPPRIIALGFQICNGKLIGPKDLFADISFNNARKKANDISDYMRRHGPFEPHRLSAEEMEYSTLPDIVEKMKDRFSDI
ncbi:MAG: fructose-1,6-bisphosphate aldolase/phosphatase [Candidatus Undinarchaeales archaeon]|jgi:fructose 1,6-bisphosphate aldolase/phosphatase|nr:fructose-1,6-bisphosphate aldolase/phosphatase [Candidatus Undinarchaeales archaeon]